jgi:hypothetical protein
MTIDHEKIRRETIRWNILLTLEKGSSLGASEEMVFSVVQGMFEDTTKLEIRRELTYLELRELLTLDASWRGKLTRHGVDVVEYTVPCEPGIARPLEKYWQ